MGSGFLIVKSEICHFGHREKSYPFSMLRFKDFSHSFEMTAGCHVGQGLTFAGMTGRKLDCAPGYTGVTHHKDEGASPFNMLPLREFNLVNCHGHDVLGDVRAERAQLHFSAILSFELLILQGKTLLNQSIYKVVSEEFSIIFVRRSALLPT